MYFLLISCVALLGIHEHFISAAPSSFDESDLQSSSIPISTTVNSHFDNSQQHGCLCSDDSVPLRKGMDKLVQHQQHFGQPYTQNVRVHGMMCMCNVPVRGPSLRDDYHYTTANGGHKLHTRVATWNEARKICNEEGGHLAIINSIAEERMLLEIYNRSGPFKGATNNHEVFLGLHDLYKEGEWVTVLGDSLAKTGYSKWSKRWGGQPDNGGGVQNCAVLVNDGGMDDVACEIILPFFCELPTMQPLH